MTNTIRGLKKPTSYLDANSLSNEWLHQICGGAQVHAGGQAGFGYSDLLPTFYERQSVEGDDGILWPQVAPLQWLAAYRGGKASCDWQRIHQLWKKLIKNTTWYTSMYCRYSQQYELFGKRVMVIIIIIILIYLRYCSLTRVKLTVLY